MGGTLSPGEEGVAGGTLSPGEEGVAGGTLPPEEVSGGWYSVSTKCQTKRLPRSGPDMATLLGYIPLA